MTQTRNIALAIAAFACIPTASFANDAGQFRVKASYYSEGKRTASGERFNPNGFTAAHRTLPFGTRLKLTNERTGHSVVVRVNDRGPFIRGRGLDVAKGAAAALGMIGAGTANLLVARL